MAALTYVKADQKPRSASGQFAMLDVLLGLVSPNGSFSVPPNHRLHGPVYDLLRCWLESGLPRVGVRRFPLDHAWRLTRVMSRATLLRSHAIQSAIASELCPAPPMSKNAFTDSMGSEIEPREQRETRDCRASWPSQRGRCPVSSGAGIHQWRPSSGEGSSSPTTPIRPFQDGLCRRYGVQHH
jgi:hypothetical protein